jgi:hypothetical protein
MVVRAVRRWMEDSVVEGSVLRDVRDELEG